MCEFGTKKTFSERKTPILEQFGTESVPIKIEGIGAIQFPLIAGREKMDMTRAPIANVITHDRKTNWKPGFESRNSFIFENPVLIRWFGNAPDLGVPYPPLSSDSAANLRRFSDKSSDLRKISAIYVNFF